MRKGFEIYNIEKRVLDRDTQENPVERQRIAKESVEGKKIHKRKSHNRKELEARRVINRGNIAPRKSRRSPKIATKMKICWVDLHSMYKVAIS